MNKNLYIPLSRAYDSRSILTLGKKNYIKLLQGIIIKATKRYIISILQSTLSTISGMLLTILGRNPKFK